MSCTVCQLPLHVHIELEKQTAVCQCNSAGQLVSIISFYLIWIC